MPPCISIIRFTSLVLHGSLYHYGTVVFTFYTMHITIQFSVSPHCFSHCTYWDKKKTPSESDPQINNNVSKSIRSLYNSRCPEVVWGKQQPHLPRLLGDWWSMYFACTTPVVQLRINRSCTLPMQCTDNSLFNPWKTLFILLFQNIVYSRFLNKLSKCMKSLYHLNSTCWSGMVFIFPHNLEISSLPLWFHKGSWIRLSISSQVTSTSLVFLHRYFYGGYTAAFYSLFTLIVVCNIHSFWEILYSLFLFYFWGREMLPGDLIPEELSCLKKIWFWLHVVMLFSYPPSTTNFSPPHLTFSYLQTNTGSSCTSAHTHTLLEEESDVLVAGTMVLTASFPNIFIRSCTPVFTSHQVELALCVAFDGEWSFMMSSPAFLFHHLPHLPTRRTMPACLRSVSVSFFCICILLLALSLLFIFLHIFLPPENCSDFAEGNRDILRFCICISNWFPQLTTLEKLRQTVLSIPHHLPDSFCSVVIWNRYFSPPSPGTH